jgi:tetratricopeptide (TPR) repeat protein
MLLAVSSCLSAQASQGSLRRSKPESSTTDSSGNLKVGEGPGSKNIHGSVKMPDGMPPEQLVEIVAACSSSHRLVTVADSKGKFSFAFDQQRQSDADSNKSCKLYASLAGYRSDEANFGDATLVIHALSSDPAGVTSTSDRAASESQKKTYRKAIDKAAKQDWKGASTTFQDLVAENPGYSSAWLGLGICLQNLGKLADAAHAYKKAAAADPTFAQPLIRAAAIEEASGDMKEALALTDKAIKLNPNAFPDAYSLNAIAAISTQNADAAEKSARAGLALDTSHQNPELEYALGMVLSTKDDPAEGRQHLQKYIEQSPDGPNVSAAKDELAQLQKTNGSEAAAPAKPEVGGPAVASEAAGVLPSTTELQNVNAPLLTKTEAYTCLESVLPARFDPGGKGALLDTIRVDIAVSGGKEIYGEADGKRFSNGTQRDTLGYSFGTTGLFSSIARALIAAGQFEAIPIGEVVANGEKLLRYNFRSLPSTSGWNISYGKDSGVAQQRGWFLVDRESRALRRVLVSATNIPSNLRVVTLTALIDYEIETIAGRRVLLPSAARIEVRESSGVRHSSLLSFDHCRAFASEAAISFDDPASGSQMEKIINPRPLPRNIQILVALNSAVTRASVLQSDLITATVGKAVINNGREVIKAGAAIEGHVRVKGGTSLAIQLDRVQTTTGWVPFYARLEKVGSSVVQIQNIGTPGQVPVALMNSDDAADLTEPDIPGVATVTFASNDVELPSGTQMIWTTGSLSVEHKEALAPQLNTSMGMH